METVSNILFALSSGLLFPVVVCLLMLFVYALVHCVTSFVDYNHFVAEHRCLNPVIDSIDRENITIKLDILQKASPSMFVSAVSQLASLAACAPARERMLADLEVNIDKKLWKSRLLVKLGPMIGLMGTLIPMGPALTGLAAGDIASMAYNMEVAFATTVIGILIAAIGMLTLQVAKRCYARMLNDLDFINEMIGDNEKAEP